jgi:RNA polymerase sigma factor (sigma-70 family)
MDRRHLATGRGPRVVAGGSYADWEAIYEDNVTRVYRMLLAGVGNWADAEDLTAEVFLAALRPLRLSATVPQVRGYLRAIAGRALVTHKRATSGVEVTSIEEIGDLVCDREDAIGTAPRRVKVLLEALPKRYRRILELRFLDGRSVKDCAEELGVSVANAKVLQHRALRLAARLDEKHP